MVEFVDGRQLPYVLTGKLQWLQECVVAIRDVVSVEGFLDESLRRLPILAELVDALLYADLVIASFQVGPDVSVEGLGLHDSLR